MKMEKIMRGYSSDVLGYGRIIIKSIHIYHTTVSHILNWFEKFHDYYHINPKTGYPCKIDLCESYIAT
jgi:hypothetical protein